MTTIAGSGHPAGSLSSIDLYLVLYDFANISPDNYDDPRRDRIIVSHGHTSPALYSCLARLGFVNPEDVLLGFRCLTSPFEGHIEKNIPGAEWTTGNLGQGLSAGCGFALAARLGKYKYRTYVAMSDAEQAKGQVGEARRFARKYDLNDLTVIIDYNHYQISGRSDEIMPVNIKALYQADGWRVIEVDGHNFFQLHKALKIARNDVDNPYLIIGQTTMGHGVSFMENTAVFHGKAPSREESKRALEELGIADDIDELIQKKKSKKIVEIIRKPICQPGIKRTKIRLYNNLTHPREAFGNALVDIAKAHPDLPIAVFDCDLTGSVKTIEFAKLRPENFFEAGVSEHTTATIAGAVSINGVLSIWADFGVFAIDEVYNQLRLNDINETNIKIIATHLGYNVGQDGKTHHCIDYIGLLRNLFGFNLIIPGDPNQTDHIIRYVLAQPGNFVVGLPRTKLPIVETENEQLFFDESYRYTYGKTDLIRDGNDCAIFTFGAMLHKALDAWDRIKQKGVTARIYNISSPLAIEKDIVAEAAGTGLVIAYEDHVAASGLGSVIGQIIAEKRLETNFLKMGIEQYGDSDDSEMIYDKYALNVDSLVRTIEQMLNI